MLKLIKSNRRLYHFVRYLLMRIRFRRYAFVSKHAWISFGQAMIFRDLIVGDYSFIGRGAYIYPHTVIGRYVLVAPDVLIIGQDHAFDKVGTPICYSGRSLLQSTIIKDDVWIGQRVVIKAGVTIGEGAIVGAGSVVTKNVSPYTIVAGNPAKYVKDRFSEEEKVLHSSLLSNRPKGEVVSALM